jgi:RNA polymerase sigma-70 factor, ECF subfamily
MNGRREDLSTNERELLAAARRGDESAFQNLIEPRRPELLAYCYRMLGSVQDAEDAVQEVLLRAWRGLGGFEARSSLRSWLYRIATNVSLSAIEQRPRRVLPIDYGPADPHNASPEAPREADWLEPFPDEALGVGGGPTAPETSYELRESVELAFIAALQHLSANQRAVLILCEVLGFSSREVAELLETTTASVNSALQRARKLVEERLPEHSQQATLRALGDERLRELVGRYMQALEQGDIDTVVAMLTDDATWSMPPAPAWYRGHAAITAFLTDGPFQLRWRHLRTRANGQPAVGCYAWHQETGRYVAQALDVLTLRGAQIAAVTAFTEPENFARFGLPKELPA